MELFYKKLDWLIEQVSKDRPTHIEINTEAQDSGTEHLVTEYYASFTANYEDKKPITAWKKYGGTLSKPEEMNSELEKDIKRLQELNINVVKKQDFQDESN